MSAPAPDPHELQRFVTAQDPVFTAVCEELRQGRKRSHWMWFVFPQIAGLGHSDMAQRYAISGLAEARAYLDHPILAPRLQQVTGLLLEWAGKRSAGEIFGSVDALKLCSSLTLFQVAGTDAAARLCADALDAFCDERRDERTMSLLRAGSL